MINWTIPQLRALLAVAQAKSFRLAAEQLNLSQPAVSARISQLEAQLGVPLLHRTTRSVLLTAAGEQMAIAARRALTELELAASQLHDQAMLESGKAVVATLPTMAESLLAPLVAGFRKLHPGISVSLIDLYEARCVDCVVTGEADFGIFTRAERHRDLTWKPWFREEILLLVPVEHPLAQRSTASLGTISSYELTGPPEGAALRATINEVFIRSNLTFGPCREAFNFHTLLGYVRSGLGLAFVPTIFASKLDSSLYHTISIRPQPILREIGLLTLRGRTLSPAAAAFASYVQGSLLPVYTKSTMGRAGQKLTRTPAGRMRASRRA